MRYALAIVIGLAVGLGLFVYYALDGQKRLAALTGGSAK